MSEEKKGASLSLKAKNRKVVWGCQIGAGARFEVIMLGTHTHTHTQGEARTHLHLFSISGWTNKQLRHAGLPGRFSCQAFVYPPFSVSGSFLLARAPLCTHTESCLYHFRGHNINSHLFSGEFCLSQSYPESKHWALQQFGVNSRSRANTDTSVKYSAIAEI